MEKKTEQTGLVKGIGALLTGRFLTSKKWEKNWPFILYLSLLTLLMIGSSHSAERKVHRISALRNEMKELSSKYIDLHSHLMQESMETKVVERAASMGLQKSPQPPKKLILEAQH